MADEILLEMKLDLAEMKEQIDALYCVFITPISTKLSKKQQLDLAVAKKTAERRAAMLQKK